MHDLPSPAEVFQAIDVYLRLAYAGAPPAAVRARVARLAGLDAQDAFYASEAFEHDAQTLPARFHLRLGNRRYPHMKLVIQRASSARGYFFAADAHDTHFTLPPGDPGEAPLARLRAENAHLAAAIDAALEAAGLPTFKGLLRLDLARRRGAPPRRPPPAG